MIRSPACATRALILSGFAGALRRSEVVAIDVEHLPGPTTAHGC